MRKRIARSLPGEFEAVHRQVGAAPLGLDFGIIETAGVPHQLPIGDGRQFFCGDPDNGEFFFPKKNCAETSMLEPSPPGSIAWPAP